MGKLNEDVLIRLSQESGRLLGEMGVRPEDERWIRRHAETIASLAQSARGRGPISRFFYRLARKAARIAR